MRREFLFLYYYSYYFSNVVKKKFLQPYDNAFSPFFFSDRLHLVGRNIRASSSTIINLLAKACCRRSLTDAQVKSMDFVVEKIQKYCLRKPKQ